MSFYGVLRTYYDAFALLWISILRLFAWYALGVPTDGCAFIFPIVSLTIVNLPITVVSAFIAGSAAGYLLYGLPYAQTDVILFNIVFCAMLGAINVILKAKIGGGNDEKAGDRVLPSLILSSLAYATLASMWPENLPQVDIGGARKSFWSMLLREFISTIVLTFSTGPLKVWLDVKRGKTSLSEMRANYEDQRLWMHKNMGVDGRPGLFPDANPNLRRRNVNSEAQNEEREPDH